MTELGREEGGVEEFAKKRIWHGGPIRMTVESRGKGRCGCSRRCSASCRRRGWCCSMLDERKTMDNVRTRVISK